MSDYWTDLLTTTGIALAIALAVILTARFVLLLAARRSPLAGQLHQAMRVPFRAFVLVVAAGPVLEKARVDHEGWTWVERTERVLLIVAIGWLVVSLGLLMVDRSLRKYDVNVPDNLHARRLRTQVSIIRRLIVGAAVVITLGAVLLTLPGVEAVGASLLASAGLLSVVAAVAAQSTLSNVFAGLQLAFSDALRLDDVVIVQEEWGRIEEITLTYVVVRAWDDRRLVLPSTYFTSTPFQNWTRHTSELLGAVELDLDWGVDTEAMRKELDRVLELTDLWDGRVKVLQVTDAIGGWVRVRVLVTARDAPTLFDLRCQVREHLVAWVRAHSDQGLPRQRVELVETPPASTRERVPDPATPSHGLFHGDVAAEERAARLGTREIPLPPQSP
jgi:small-conductance mechanosensitive channel